MSTEEHYEAVRSLFITLRKITNRLEGFGFALPTEAQGKFVARTVTDFNTLLNELEEIVTE